MSLNRRTPTRYQNTAFFAHQQNKMHVAQKRAGMHDVCHSEFKFVPGQLNVANITFWLFFLGFIQSAYGQVKVDQKLRDLALDRTVVEEKALAAGLDKSQCSIIADKIGALAAVNSDFRENTLGVLSQSLFKISCTTLNVLKEITKSDITEAAFLVDLDVILMAVDSLHDAALTHEMLHARMAQLHNAASNCHIARRDKNKEPAVPVFPANEENIKAFENCMAKGVNRINELNRILKKSRTNKPLSEEEKFQLGRAHKALEGVILDIGEFRQPSETLQDLKEIGWPAIPASMTFMDASILITNATPNERGVILQGKAETGIDAAVFGINSYEELKRRNAFANKGVEIAERIAYSLQQLDRKARHFLFPELSKLLTREQQKCLRAERAEL